MTEQKITSIHRSTRCQISSGGRLRKALNNTRLSFAACLSACTLVGCFSAPYKTTVAAATGLSPTEVTVLRVALHDESKGYLWAMIQNVYDSTGHDLLNPDGGNPRSKHQVTLPPGEYALVIHVRGGYRQLDAYPHLSVRIEAGKTYDIAALSTMDRHAVRVVYREAGAGVNP